MRYPLIDGLRKQYPVRRTCRVFEVSENGYYAYSCSSFFDYFLYIYASIIALLSIPLLSGYEKFLFFLFSAP